MNEVVKITDLNIDDVVLSPWNKLLKIIGIPILSFLGIVLYILLRGFAQNRYMSVQPFVLHWGWSIGLILFLMFCFFAIIVTIFRFYNYSELKGDKINLMGAKLQIENSRYVMSFKINQADFIRISISKIWGLFFVKFYRIGKIKIKYKGDKYTFLFPVRDMIIEEQIKNIKSSK